MKRFPRSNTDSGRSVGFHFTAIRASAFSRLLGVCWLALALWLLCSCATPERPKVEPWVKDNQKIGTVTSVKCPWGYDYRYQDLSGRLVRLEKRDDSRQLCGGACLTKFDYDPAGNLSAAQHLAASEEPCLTMAGYALCRWAYSQAADASRTVEESYFDCEGKLVSTHAGYAVMRRTSLPDGKLKRVELLDPSRKPAAAFWLGVSNVAEVQYSYLQGIGEVTCAAFLDATGTVIARKQLDGKITEFLSDSVTTYNYHYRSYGHR